MLVVSRRRDQAVRIGDDIHVVVLAVEGRTVQLGISAPSEKLVLRTELIDRERSDRPGGEEGSADSSPPG